VVSAIITAAGAGARFGGDVPKQFARMANGKRVVENAIAPFLQAGVGEIILTVPRGYENRVDVPKMVQLLPGGENRAESIRAALACVSDAAEIVLVHDGVRPLVCVSLITAVIAAARVHGAAVPGLPLAETIKEVDAAGRVVATPARARYAAVQTPQGFQRGVIVAAYASADSLAGYTDDASLVEAMGGAVFIVPGQRRNIKITTADDLHIANAWMEAQE